MAVFQCLTICVQAVGMIAIVCVIGDKGDPLMSERNEVLHSLDARRSRLVVCKRQPRMIESVAQHDRGKTFFANPASNVAVGGRGPENGAADTFAEKEL